MPTPNPNKANLSSNGSLNTSAKANPSLGLAQSRSGPTPFNRKHSECTLCHKVARLQPAFEEKVAGHSVVLELCFECYEQAAEDEKWLYQQLKILIAKAKSAQKPLTNGDSSQTQPSILTEVSASNFSSAELEASPLAQARIARGLSRPELARLSGVDRASIRKLECGLSYTRPRTIAKLAEALQLPLSELTYLLQSKPRPRRRLPGRANAPDHAKVFTDTASSQRGAVIDPPLQGGALLAQLRIERNLTQTELGQLCQLKRSTISRLENGDTSVKLSQIKKLSQFFGISLVQLAPGRTIQLELDNSTS